MRQEGSELELGHVAKISLMKMKAADEGAMCHLFIPYSIVDI